MNEVKITGNKVKIEYTASINSKKQLLLFKQILRISKMEAIDYLKSFSGTPCSKRMVINYKKDSGLIDLRVDKLANKPQNHYIRMLNSMFDTSESHKPTQIGLGDWLGVEIECLVPRFDSVSNDCDCHCTNSDCEEDSSYCEHDYHECDSSDSQRNKLGDLISEAKIKRCNVKSDGSISEESGYFPVELTILFKKNDSSPLEKLCELLNQLGAKVNKSCGLHIHLDQRDLIENGKTDTRKLNVRARNLGGCLGVFSKVIPKSRLNNSYCKLKVSKIDGDRYSAINMTSVKKYGTIEVRMHSSTTDFVKIKNWVDLLLIVSKSKRVHEDSNTISDLCMNYDIPEHLIKYLEHREEKFKNGSINNGPSIEEDPTAQMFNPVPLVYSNNTLNTRMFYYSCIAGSVIPVID